MNTEVLIYADINILIDIHRQATVIYTHMSTILCVQLQMDISKLINACIQAVTIYKAIFGNIVLTQDLILGYDNLVDYKDFTNYTSFIR